MSIARNEILVPRYFEERINQDKAETIDKLISPTYVSHYPAGYGPSDDPASVKQIVATVLRGTSDLHFTLEDFVAQGEKVVARWTFRGMDDGKLIGIVPAVKHTQVPAGFDVYRITHGQIEEVWLSWDVFGRLKQLDVLPS